MHMGDDCSGDILEGVEKELRYAEECLKSNVFFRRSTPQESERIGLAPVALALCSRFRENFLTQPVLRLAASWCTVFYSTLHRPVFNLREE